MTTGGCLRRKRDCPAVSRDVCDYILPYTGPGSVHGEMGEMLRVLGDGTGWRKERHRCSTLFELERRVTRAASISREACELCEHGWPSAVPAEPTMLGLICWDRT